MIAWGRLQRLCAENWKLLSVHLRLNQRHLKQEFCLPYAVAVVLERDSQVVVNALAGSSPPPSAVASIIQGLLELCRGFTQIQSPI